ncbi:MAG: hypothetical protein KDK39_15510 [Leptospiraceae bacterium]|nr:hypothetical protein [Leptospiraceae bacterium]
MIQFKKIVALLFIGGLCWLLLPACQNASVKTDEPVDENATANTADAGGQSLSPAERRWQLELKRRKQVRAEQERKAKAAALAARKLAQAKEEARAIAAQSAREDKAAADAANQQAEAERIRTQQIAALEKEKADELQREQERLEREKRAKEAAERERQRQAALEAARLEEQKKAADLARQKERINLIVNRSYEGRYFWTQDLQSALPESLLLTISDFDPANLYLGRSGNPLQFQGYSLLSKNYMPLMPQVSQVTHLPVSVGVLNPSFLKNKGDFVLLYYPRGRASGQWQLVSLALNGQTWFIQNIYSDAQDVLVVDLEQERRNAREVPHYMRLVVAGIEIKP